MSHRHKHLALTQLPEPHIVLHDRVAARVAVLVAQPLEDPLGRVALLPAFRLVAFQDLVDGSGPGIQLGPTHRLLPPIARRHRVPQHLPHRLASQSELLGRLALAHLVDDDRSPHSRIQLHCVHLSGVPQNISLWECSMEPVSWRPGFAPPATPLTRHLLVYFRSGAYTNIYTLSHTIAGIDPKRVGVRSGASNGVRSLKRTKR